MKMSKKSFFGILLLSSVLVLFIYACKKESIPQTEQNKISELKKFQWPTIIFGTHSKPCGSGSGCYCDGDKGICLLINPKSININGNLNDIPIDTNEGIAEVSILENNKIKFRMIRDDSWVNDTTQHIFHVFETVNLPDIFESRNVTIKKGEYQILYNENLLGDIILDIQ